MTTNAIDPDVVGLWQHAVGRGWTWEFVRGADGPWNGHATGNVAGVAYIPPDEVSNGWLECHDDDRTLTLTGITSHAEAAERARQFLDWPALSGLPDPATTVPSQMPRWPTRTAP